MSAFLDMRVISQKIFLCQFRDHLPDSTEHQEHHQSYFCDLESKSGPSLCEGGDEGSPLLCKPHIVSDGISTHEPVATIGTTAAVPPNNNTFKLYQKSARQTETNDFYIYGLADTMPNKVDCVNNTADRQRVLFVYTLRSVAVSVVT